METQVCAGPCGRELPLDAFGASTRKGRERTKRCLECCRARAPARGRRARAREDAHAPAREGVPDGDGLGPMVGLDAETLERLWVEYREGIVRQLFARAARGDLKATDLVFRHLKQAGVKLLPGSGGEDDELTLDELISRDPGRVSFDESGVA